MSSKSILFIVPYPHGVAASQRFRFEQYLEILIAKGYSYKLSSFWSKKGWDALYSEKRFTSKIVATLQGFLKRFLLIFTCLRYHFIFLHRETLPLGPPLLEFILARILRKKMIYDFDDAIWLPNTSDQNRFVAIFKFHQKVKYISKWSWKVSCGNEFLADYAKQFSNYVIVNPTTIDLNYHVPTKKPASKDEIVIGWTGTHSTTKYLTNLSPLLSKLLHKYPIKICIISDQQPDWDLEEYEFVRWNGDEEIKQLNKFDIGIMPLNNSVWEEGKCGFKALQYMALEIPAVVSNVGVNKQIIEHGTDGYLCDSLMDWEQHLVELISSSEKRMSIGRMGRLKVKSQYSVQSNATRFLSLFE